MTRYLKQRDYYSCGPTAVINAVKWQGEWATWDDCVWLYRLIAKCTHPYGCCPEHLNKLIRHEFGRKASVLKGKPTMKYMDWWLDQGNSIILRYFWHDHKENERVGHYIFIPSRTEKYYNVVNDGFRRPTLTRRSRKTMNNYLRMQKEGDTCCTWFIRK